MPHENQYKWLSPPTIEQIEAAVKAANVSESQFERFHNIYEGCIRDIRYGKRNMPAKHWHLFFDTAESSLGKFVGNGIQKETETHAIAEEQKSGSLTELF